MANEDEEARDDDQEGAEEDAKPVIPPEILLPKVERQAKIGKVLTVTLIFISLLTIISVGTGMIVMFDRISTLERMATVDKEDDLVDQQFDALEERLLSLAEFRKSEIKKIQIFTSELEKLSAECSVEKAQPFLAYLSEREQNLQQFIDTVKSGTGSLAGMNKGSRQWLDEHNKALADLKALSVERQAQLDILL